jgi:hypothetical protein
MERTGLGMFESSSISEALYRIHLQCVSSNRFSLNYPATCFFQLHATVCHKFISYFPTAFTKPQFQSVSLYAFALVYTLLI